MPRSSSARSSAHQRGLLEITHAAEQLAAEVIRYHRLPAPIVRIEHHPPIAPRRPSTSRYLLRLRGQGEGAVPGRDALDGGVGHLEADDARHGRGARRRGGIAPVPYDPATARSC
jgi:hypothetical protein